jgi:hypothetical protein
MLAGLSNIILVGLFAVAVDRQAIRPLISLFDLVSSTAAAPDSLNTTRAHRRDYKGLASNALLPRKGSLAMTRISSSSTSIGSTDASGEQIIDSTTLPFDASPSAEEVQGLKIAPILRKDNAGELEIGNFKSLFLAGGTGECLEIGYSMLGDTHSSDDLLDIITATDQITIARICAKNGSVVISCRNEQITVSPRRSRPDDNCQRAALPSITRS